ncbi:hypothetical protein [Ruegeria conchae]|uniref:TIGR04255 family protein n=1 Tax=Ruegeria conchae TaxID=981384 RepID=A0A497ZHZ3_9RHOB|nr:hypothetical protein [Ruegeria conchae]RLK07422.1 hypothetical protein CLV75_2545 [Ruegeria conchae]
MGVIVESDRVSAVLIGAFNPSIFHPSWLALNDLISSESLDAAELQVSHPDLSRFDANFMSFEVQKSRVIIGCEADKDGLVFDMVRSIFGELLTHSPVWRIGINRSFEILCGTEEKRNELGKRMAPQSAWGKWGEEIASAQGTKHGGMQRLTMRQIPRHDGREGHFQADLRPGSSSQDLIRLDFNSDLVAGKEESVEGALKATNLIEECWQLDLAKAKEVSNEIVEIIEGL